MKRSLISILTVLSPLAMATVDGYKDIYLDREQPIQLHSIYCGSSLDDLRSLKNTYIYSNSEYIEKGTYYFNSPFGNFSYTFDAIEGKDPKSFMVRGLLTAGKTNKQAMLKEECIVGKVEGLPAILNTNIKKTTMAVDDPQWNATMSRLGMFGKPAFGEGVFVDPRTTEKYAAKDQAVYDANQAYITAATGLFEKAFNQQIQSLPDKVEQAVAYAIQENGFIENKQYPKVEKPSVWTPIAKKRYDQQTSRLIQTKQWDQIIQQNFDWLFSVMGQDNQLESVAVKSTSGTRINQGTLEKIVTLDLLLENDKTLELDFAFTSAALPNSVFHTLTEISQRAKAARNSPIAGNRASVEPIAQPSEIDVYSNVEKTAVFFTPFRANQQADNYRYR